MSHVDSWERHPPDRRMRVKRRGAVLFGLAFAYSVVLLGVAVAVPMIDGETWLQHFGPECLVTFGMPLVVSLAMWPLLEGPTAWHEAAACLLATANLLYAMLSWYLAFMLLPPALLLVGAVIRSHPPRAGRRR